MKARIPTQEASRLQALYQYKILDTPAEQIYDDITALAAFICKVPIALISLVDHQRQWFKSQTGVEVRETSRDVSFCAHAILGDRTLIVQDAMADPRFAENDLVTCAPNIRFYAGVPLITPAGYGLGTLCVIDHQPRTLSDAQIAALEALARQIVVQLEFRRVSSDLAAALGKIKLLEGVLPICAYCKGIRNDQGYWSTVEKFIEAHADVDFTHGVCDRCMEQHFPEVAAAIQAEQGHQEDVHSSS